MKTLKLIFVLISISSNSIWAQNYIPFPDSNATWCDGNYFVWGPGPYDTTYSFFKTSGAILINDTLYTAIKNQNLFDICYLREEGKKIYCRFDPYESEFIFYDFDLELGDTIYLYMRYGEGFSENYVTEIDSLLIGSKYHKRFSLENWDWIPFKFIEGIGSEQGLMYCNISWVDWGGSLKCFSLNDTIFNLDGSGNSSPGNCFLYLDVPENLTDIINVNPNPTQNKVFISDGRTYEIKLFNILGEMKIHCKSSSIDLEGLNNGIYFLYVFNGQQLVLHKKIIKLKAR